MSLQSNKTQGATFRRNVSRKQINIAVVGHGNVGALLIDQIVAARKSILSRRGIDLNIFAISNTTTTLLSVDGIDYDWRLQKQISGEKYSIKDVIRFARNHHLKNLVLVDNTASVEFVDNYLPLIHNEFNLVSSNKNANTLGWEYYKKLRDTLSQKGLHYLYETNVGAGLPLIDTIKLLHLSGENITRIRGVFSGSLSYLFNTFSVLAKPFSEVLRNAIEKGYTEPDPREDLCGNDVAKKLLILARELDLHNELEDVEIENLIPKPLRTGTKALFLQHLEECDPIFQEIKNGLTDNQVLRYVADLSGDLSREKGAQLSVKLEKVPQKSMLGALTGSDSLFEIFTESYGDNPITIQGAGAGAAVTARGVLGDILRISEKMGNYPKLFRLSISNQH